MLLTALVTFGLATVLTLVSFDDAISHSENSRSVSAQVRHAEQLLTLAVSQERGYLYTGQNELLPDINETRRDVLMALSEAEELTTWPEQDGRLRQMRELATKRLDTLEKTVALFEAGKTDEARVLVESGSGNQYMLDFHREAEDIVLTERRLMREANQSISQLSGSLKILIVLGILALVVLSFLWLRMVRARLAPLELCVERARQVANNNFPGTDLPVVFADDEVGSLTGSLNEMTSALYRGATKVEAVREQVQLTALSLSDRVIEQSTALTQLSSGIQEISATVQELNLSASQMSAKVKGLVDGAASRGKAGVRGLNAVDESVKATAKVRDQVQSVADFTVHLNEKAAQVERIVFFVNELTERSNILSINAALLAAGSGEESAAFGVLAEEMQKLTSRSKDSTLEIHETLQTIRSQIQRVVMATEETTKQVEAGDNAAQQAARSIRVLKDTVDEGNDTFLQIVAAVRQQNQALEQVEQALVAMRESAQLVEEGSLSLKEDAAVLASLNLELKNSDLLKAVRS